MAYCSDLNASAASWDKKNGQYQADAQGQQIGVCVHLLAEDVKQIACCLDWSADARPQGMSVPMNPVKWVL